MHTTRCNDDNNYYDSCEHAYIALVILSTTSSTSHSHLFIDSCAISEAVIALHRLFQRRSFHNARHLADGSETTPSVALACRTRDDGRADEYSIEQGAADVAGISWLGSIGPASVRYLCSAPFSASRASVGLE